MWAFPFFVVCVIAIITYLRVKETKTNHNYHFVKVLAYRLLPISELRRRKPFSKNSYIVSPSQIITYLRVKETKTFINL